MRIEFHADHAVRPDDRTRAFHNVASHIVVAVRDHGTMQPKENPIEWPCGLELDRIPSRMTS